MRALAIRCGAPAAAARPRRSATHPGAVPSGPPPMTPYDPRSVTKTTTATQHTQMKCWFVVCVAVVLPPWRVSPWAQQAPPPQAEVDAFARPASGGPSMAAPTDRETALAILERAARPFATYTALKGNTLIVVTEVTRSSIQNARWRAGADVQITASTSEGARVTTTRGRIEPGSYSAVVPLTIDLSKPPARLSIDLTAPGERPANDWLNLPRAAGTLVGDPLAYRSASREMPRPVAAFEFARNERIRVEWPVLASSLDRREARLLDHTGKLLPVDLPLSADPASKMVVLDVSLSGLPRGDYLFELTVGVGAATERHLLAIRIRQ